MATPKKKSGRPRYFSPQDELSLLELAKREPERTLRQLAERFVEEHAPKRKRPCAATVMRVLKRHGYSHLTRRDAPKPAAAPAPTPTSEVRYHASHRPSRRQGYPSDLTDKQWAKVCGLLERPGARGPRPQDPRKTLDAIMYTLRTGCQWRYLPREFGHWNSVAKTFYRWRDSGVLERVHDALKDELRVQVGKSPSPSMVMLDSQSVKTSEKGGLAATMLARKSRGESATSSWTPSDC